MLARTAALAILASLAWACTSGGGGPGGGGAAGDEVVCGHVGDTTTSFCPYWYNSYTCVCAADGLWHWGTELGGPCTPPPCEATCEAEGKTYVAGETFPAPDSCNTCTCVAGTYHGEAQCTEMACDPACEGFSDDPSGGVWLIIHNDTGRTVYVVASGCAETGPSPQITSADGGEYGDPAPCEPTCHQLERGTAPASCTCQPRMDVMAPGAVQEHIAWSARQSLPATLPASCAADPSSADLACQRHVSAPYGTYEVSVVVYTECPDCQAGTVGPGTPGGKRAVSAPVSLPYGQTNSIDVVLGPDLFGP